MPLRVINHYPDINAVDIPRNISIKIEFNSGLIPSSLKYTTISVNDAATYTTVPGNLGVEYNTSGQAVTAVFQPLLNLTANTKYRVYVFKEPNSILSVGNEQLKTTYSWEFTTGIDVLEGEMPEGIPSGELDISGVPGGDEELSNSGITTLYVVSTNPQNQQPNVATRLSGIYITFNTDIVTPNANLSDYISISEGCIF